MPEHAASNPSTMPTRPQPSASGTATPPAATTARVRTQRPAVLDKFRMAMNSLRGAMRRTARHK
jgi:hypothetical protein